MTADSDDGINVIHVIRAISDIIARFVSRSFRWRFGDFVTRWSRRFFTPTCINVARDLRIWFALSLDRAIIDP